MSPLLYLEDLGVILKNFGYYQGSLALVCALGSFLYGSIIHKIDQWKMLIFAGGIWIASMVMITSVLNSTNALFITLAFIPFIVGQLFPSTTLYPLCLNIMPAAKGKISALIQAGRLILAGVSVQIAGYYYVGSFKNIGIIINVFILLSVVTLFLVIRNREIREFSEPKP
jgi:DHA1 family bicyclomycin/chloramphenicol resistance-like MFS transporter